MWGEERRGGARRGKVWGEEGRGGEGKCGERRGGWMNERGREEMVDERKRRGGKGG